MRKDGRGQATARRRKHYAPRLALERRTPAWGVGERRSSLRVSFIPGELLRGGIGEGNGKERSAASGYVVSHRSGGNCAATVSVRSAVAVRPERVESEDGLPLFRSCAAVE